MEDHGTLTIQYRFDLADGSRELFDLRLNLEKIELIDADRHGMPSWAKLAFHQCPNCPFGVDSLEYCPVAANISPFIAPFEKLLSYDQVRLTVTMPERCIFKETSAQRALSSLLGLAIAASGCPHTNFLKPMARFHQPMASEEETIFRATSTYMLAQYFRKKSGQDADFGLEGLTGIFEELQILNTGMAKRLRAASQTDSSVNAIIQLDMYAKAMPYVIKQALDEIRYLFIPFLQDTPGVPDQRLDPGLP